MVRILNVLAVLALIGSAIYAYSIKYDTIFHAERIVKLKHQIKAEQDRIATLKAEWSHLTRPEQVQVLSDKFLELQPMSLRQIVALDALPRRVERGDVLGGKLGALGLADPEPAAAPAPAAAR